MEDVHPSFILTLALTLGVLAQSFARHMRIPGIVVLLGVGVLMGPDLLGWIHPRSLGDGLFYIVDIGVAVILFEGGLNLEISRLRRAQISIRRLITLGALVTLCGGALAAFLLMGWSPMVSLMFGSLVVVTGPTVIGPLVSELRLQPRVATVLEAEGVLIDPIGVILAILVLEVALAPAGATLGYEFGALALRVGFGVFAGTVVGLLLAYGLRLKHLVPEGLENITVLASALLLFQGCDEVMSHSGIVAVTVAGIWVGNIRTRVDRDLREFKDQLTVLLIGLIFILLAADVGLGEVQRLGWRGVGVLAVLMFVVRPLSVALSTWGSQLRLNERIFVGWIAPRGIVAAAVASLTSTLLVEQGIEAGVELRALVFLVIAGTVVWAGVTAKPVAALLKLRLPGRDTVVILSCQGLARTLAQILGEHGTRVVLIDSNPHYCREAEEAGFQVIYGNALKESTLSRARLERVSVAIGLTPNETLNSLFVEQARDQGGVPQGYVSVARLDSDVTPELLHQRGARVLFDGPHDVERWDVRARHSELSIEYFEYADVSESDDTPHRVEFAERCLILSIQRGNRIDPMSLGFEPKLGDIAAVAIHEGDAEDARRLLTQLGWVPSTSPKK